MSLQYLLQAFLVGLAGFFVVSWSQLAFVNFALVTFCFTLGSGSWDSCFCAAASSKTWVEV